MSEPTPTETACQVPLIERLESVPCDRREFVRLSDHEYRNIPYGRLCQEAAESIRSLEQRLTESHAEIARLREELASEKDEAESSLTGRMEYLAEMGFPYGCTWDEAIHAQKQFRKELADTKEKLKISNDPDYAVLVYQELDTLRAERALIFSRLQEESKSDSNVASCNCQTKTPEIQHHAIGCKYRLISERDTLRVQVAEINRHMALARTEAGCPDDETLVIHCQDLRAQVASLAEERDHMVKCENAIAKAHDIIRAKDLATPTDHPGVELLAAVGRACEAARRHFLYPESPLAEEVMDALAPYAPKQS